MLYRLDMNTYELSPFWQLKNFTVDLSHIVVDETSYNSSDGTTVPLTIVRNSKFFPSLDEKPSEPVPTILYVYGGFASSNTLYYEPDRLVWLNNYHGMIAFTHVRGGGELGLTWHE